MKSLHQTRGDSLSPPPSGVASTQWLVESRSARFVATAWSPAAADQSRIILTPAYNRLEAFVFETLILSFQSDNRWNQRLGEKDPEVDAKIDKFEVRLTDLQEQQRRINELYIAGDIDRLQHSEQVQRVKDESVAIQRQRDKLLGKPLLSKALESGIENWRDWPPMKRRSFLKQVVARVEVGRWPEATSRTLPRRKDDTDDSLRERREGHLLEAMKKRARIVF